MADDYNGYGSSGQSGSSNQGYPQTYQAQQGYAAQSYQSAYASTQQKAKKGGAGKTFLAGFLGALLACALAFGGMGVWNSMNVSQATSNSSKSASAASESAQSIEIGGTSTITLSASDTDPTLAEVVAAKALPSVVCIYVYTEQSYGGYYGYGGSRSRSGATELVESSLGSGVILTEDGYILTNYHVIEGADALKVNIGGEEYDGVVVGTDASSDLAVVKVSGTTGLTAIEVGDSDSLNVGEWVMTIGAPFGLEQSVATGVVSAISRSQIMEGTSSSDPYSYLYGYGQSSSQPTLYPNLIQTDAAINPGNSGGALVDAEGKLIGINTLITSYSGNYSGVGFAIPINYAINIAQQIIDGKTPTHAKIGVSLQTVTSSIASRYKLSAASGAYVSAVTGEAALQAGLQEGDIIVKIEGKKMTSATDVTLAVREHNPGDTITVTVDRGGNAMDLSLVLGSDEEDLAAQATTRESTQGEGRGYSYEDILDYLRNR